MRFVPRVGLATLCLAALAAAVPPASAQAPARFHLERVVPQDAFALITVPDVSAVEKALSRTSLAKIFREEEVQEFIAPIVELLRGQLAELKDEEGVDLLDMLTCLRGELGLAFIGMDLSKGDPIPDLLISVDARESLDKAKKYVDLLVAKIRADNEKFGVTEREVRGVTIRVLDDGRTRLDVAFLGSTFVLASKPATLDAAIAAWAGGETASLAKLPRYRTAMERVTGAGVPAVRVFVNLQRILATYRDAFAQYADILTETGVLGIQAVAFSSTVDGAGFTDRIHVHAPGEKRGLFRLVSRRPADRKVLSIVPRNALHVTAGTMELDKVWDEVMRILATVYPDAFADVSANIAQAEGFLGFKLREELIASLGGDYFLSLAAPQGGGLIPELVLGLSLRDADTFAKCLDSALAIVGEKAGEDFQRTSLEFRGRTIQYVRLAQGVPVTPSWTVIDGRLLITLMPQTLKSVIRKLDTEEPVPSILDNPAFREGLKDMPESSSMISYTDLPAAFSFAYNSVLPFMPLLTQNLRGVPVDFSLLPSAEAISQHLTPTHSAVWADDDGITYTAHAPISFVTAITALAPVFLLLSAGGEAEVTMVEAEPTWAEKPRDPDLVNLDEVGAGLLIHYVEQGSYPATFEELVKTRALPDASVLVSPGDKAPVTVGNIKSSYEYAGAAVAKLKGNKHRAVVAWTRSGPRRAVLFLDGGVRRVAEGEFQNLLAETKARIAALK